MKVAIIGAGITGLYLAWKLSEKGHNVTVFERRGMIGKEACSGLFSERVLEFIPESKKLVQNQIDFCFLRLPKKTLKINFSKKFFVMSHYALDNLVALLAQKSGVKIVRNRNVTRQDLVTLQNEFDRIVGTDGANSVVRKSLGLPDPYFRLGIQGFWQENNPEGDALGRPYGAGNDNYVDAWPTKYGFLWKIPRGEELAESSSRICPSEAKGGRRELRSLLPPRLFRLGVRWSQKQVSSPVSPLARRTKFSEPPRGRQKAVSITEWGIIERPTRARKIFEEFLKEKNISIDNIKSTLVPRGLVIPKNEKITLLGDAAGMTKPWSGGGVAWGLTGASLLLKNFPDFIKYRNEARKFFLPKIFFSKAATRMIYFLGLKTPWFLPTNYKIESDFLL